MVKILKITELNLKINRIFRENQRNPHILCTDDHYLQNQ
jgi:hypothetical protein